MILLGRIRSPVRESVRALLGIRGEPATPDDPANGKVRRAIGLNVIAPGGASEWVSASDIARGRFHEHPWSLSGGGAQELQEALGAASEETLGVIAVDIGITAVTGEDGLDIPGDAATPNRPSRVVTERLCPRAEHRREPWNPSDTAV